MTHCNLQMYVLYVVGTYVFSYLYMEFVSTTDDHKT